MKLILVKFTWGALAKRRQKPFERGIQTYNLKWRLNETTTKINFYKARI